MSIRSVCFEYRVREVVPVVNHSIYFKMMNDSMKQQYEKNGFLVIEGLLNEEECDELRASAYALGGKLMESVTEIPFCTGFEDDMQYFLESNDKIRPFSEKRALDFEGLYRTDPVLCVNKIGHAIHWSHPLFRCYTYCDRVKAVCRFLGLQQPAVVQSMIIFKNPAISRGVDAHQDATFLHSEPTPVVGFWFALDDATVQNGCLWIASGSHKSGLHRRLRRHTNNDSNIELIFDGPNPTYPASNFMPVPVKKGSCIILHGLVVHKSLSNITGKARPAYTFHVIEMQENVYSTDNWLLEGPLAPFSNMYQVQQVPTDMLPDDEAGNDENISGEASP